MAFGRTAYTGFFHVRRTSREERSRLFAERYSEIKAGNPNRGSTSAPAGIEADAVVGSDMAFLLVAPSGRFQHSRTE